MLTVWLIRHAESESNIGLPTLEPAGVKLTERGRAQAEQIATAFTERPSLIVTSSFLRAKQTAQPTIHRFQNSPQTEWPVHEFTYLSPSRHLMMTIAERRPEVEAYWQQCNPGYIDGEGAESFILLMERARNILIRFRPSSEGFIAVFSHGQFIRAILWLLLNGDARMCPESMRQFRDFLTSFSLPNGALVKLKFEKPGAVWFSPIITSHLDTVA